MCICVNNGGCETFDDIYICIYIYISVLREILFIYMHNMYNMQYHKIPANEKELNGKHKIN